MALQITRGIMVKPQKVVIYGPEGIGKTSFAAQFPDPLFIDTEGGSQAYDIARLPRPLSWSELMQQVRDVRAEKPCATLVLDTADWAEKLCIEHVCAVYQWQSIETPGYGKGFTAVNEEFAKLLDELSNVVDAGINVCVTAHAATRKFEQPDEATSYDRWELKLAKKNAPVVKEWADALLFANYKPIVEVVVEGMSKKGKARKAKRVLNCAHHACWDAKNRWGLPEETEFSYSVIAPYIPNTTQLGHAATPEITSTPEPEAFGDWSTNSIEFTQCEWVPGDELIDRATPQLPAYWAPAQQLMERDGVTADELRAMVAAKGFMTADTPLEAYPEEFVAGAIVGQWDGCLRNIQAMRDGQSL